MNSFETDLKRAIFSVPFFLGILLEFIILNTSGFNSDLFRVTLPVLATFPYTTAWITDYESGFVKLYVSRTTVNAYILGKIIVCGISGGLLELAGCYLYMLTEPKVEINLVLIFLSGMLWAIVSATLAAFSNSRYIAYGGAFVIYYLLVILHDRYFKEIYCMYPYEWIHPEHTWIFEEQGVVALLVGITLIFVCIYYCVVRRYIERV